MENVLPQIYGANYQLHLIIGERTRRKKEEKGKTVRIHMKTMPLTPSEMCREHQHVYYY